MPAPLEGLDDEMFIGDIVCAREIWVLPLCVHSVKTVVFMSSLSIAFCVFLGVSLMSLVSAVKERKQEEEANRKFTDGTCKMLSLPREVTWHRGGMILADLDSRGNSILIFRRRTCRIPQTLAKDGIQAWNISPREAKILIETNCPGRFDEDEE